ncbi:MAG: hypothetical protein SVQ76_00165 [Candidatus Nanohaloarchaea archaeon]|nr:hypothetical protein [Candidatus Nanohaloarchaea archaeon]
MIGSSFYRSDEDKCPKCGDFGVEEDDHMKCPTCETEYNEYVVLQEGGQVQFRNN